MISQLLLGLFLSQLERSKTNFPDTPLLIGHRGARARAPENTLASFKLAMDLGANGIEFDVYLSADKIPFVIHDDTLKRTTNGQGVAFKKTLAQLKKLDASKGWPTYLGEKIPTLKETLDLMPDGAVVNIELKGEGDRSKDEFAETILSIVAACGDRLFIIVSSFDARLLEILRSKNASLCIGFLLENRIDHALFSLVKMKAIRPNTLHIPPVLAKPWIIRLAHSKGLRVMVWTVNENAKCEKLLETGVDGIFSDLPEGFVWKDSRL